RTVEELAFVELNELSSIDGFDEDTAQEIQNRARDNLARIEEELDAKRRELGVADELREVEGLTTAMMVKLGENDVRTLEDLAGCATDDLVGWTEREGAEAVRYDGYFEGIDISREDAEALVMRARVLAGWVDPADMEQPAEEAAEGEDAPAEEKA
ncbi:MAG: transcription termination/antitermination protein NusA, partial [Caulobacteraceae bacterium]|nr:transcription termination/antitermination protein NusA [Caulobacter sp.]